MPRFGQPDVAPGHGAATWCRVVAAAALDIPFAFFIAEYVVGYLAGKAAKGGFALTGLPALAVLGAIALYFVVCTSFLGGTVCQRALGLTAPSR
jgi:hypothetical protein